VNRLLHSKEIVEDRAEGSLLMLLDPIMLQNIIPYFAPYTLGYPEMMLVEVQDGCRFRSLLGVILGPLTAFFVDREGAIACYIDVYTRY
jgi:hypothetical protein